MKYLETVDLKDTSTHFSGDIIMRRDEIPVVKSYAEDKVKEERKRWIGAVNDIKDEINALEPRFDSYTRSINIIDKHVELLMHPSEESVDSDEEVMKEIK